MKSIEFTSSQIEAFQDDVSMFIVPLDSKVSSRIKSLEYGTIRMECKKGGGISWDNIEKFIEVYSPLQIGDKDVFIKEGISYSYKGIPYRQFGYTLYKTERLSNPSRYEWQPASQMTKEQSRHSIDEILDTRVVQVQDLTPDEWHELGLRMSVPHEDVMWKYIAEAFDSLMQEKEDAHYQEHGMKITLPKYSDNPYVFLYTHTSLKD